MENIDYDIVELWNRTHEKNVYAEEIWDIFGKLEEAGYVTSNNVLIGAYKIGPFRIAKIKGTKYEYFKYFIETIIPIFMINYGKLGFKQFHSEILVPLVDVFLETSEKTCLIKDDCQWNLLTFLNREYKNGRKYTVAGIIAREELNMYSSNRIMKSLDSLQQIKSIQGQEKQLVTLNDGYVIPNT